MGDCLVIVLCFLLFGFLGSHINRVNQRSSKVGFWVGGLFGVLGVLILACLGRKGGL